MIDDPGLDMGPYISFLVHMTLGSVGGTGGREIFSAGGTPVAPQSSTVPSSLSTKYSLPAFSGIRHSARLLDKERYHSSAPSKKSKKKEKNKTKTSLGDSRSKIAFPTDKLKDPYDVPTTFRPPKYPNLISNEDGFKEIDHSINEEEGELKLMQEENKQVQASTEKILNEIEVMKARLEGRRLKEEESTLKMLRDSMLQKWNSSAD
ncbi:hypothetical protein BU17DRAFT_63044 [Hysterangium stoloniferum]|nr:hypothetical protein BU17DRAFT_63044 [Hysterangium stoloniferum]